MALFSEAASRAGKYLLGEDAEKKDSKETPLKKGIAEAVAPTAAGAGTISAASGIPAYAALSDKNAKCNIRSTADVMDIVRKIKERKHA